MEIIKRLLKVLLFIPFSVATWICFPFAAIIWIATGVLPQSPLQYLMDW